MISIPHFIGIVILSILAAVLASCGVSSQLDSPYAGRTLEYVPGSPNFDMEAVVTIQDGRPGVDLNLGIPYASLIYSRSDDEYTAAFETVFRLLDRRGRRIIVEETGSDTVRVAEYERTQSFQTFVVRHRLQAEAGDYIAEVILIDSKSGQEAVRRQVVHIDISTEAGITLSQVQLQGKREESVFQPIVSLYVPGDYDTLRAVVQAGGSEANRVFDITMSLVQFASDTSIATPPYWFSPSFGSLSYRGFDDRNPDTLQVSRRTIEVFEEPIEVFFTFPHLTEGIYRIEVSLGSSLHEVNKSGEKLRQERTFLLASPFFPQILTLDQMIEALFYVAKQDEWEAMREGETPIERREKFDAFWGAIIPNREQAANTIKLYYSRVEEANRLFTTHKEGWKTDRGMIYIVFGPPVYIEYEIDREIWHYSLYGGTEQLERVIFERAEHTLRRDPFINYVLERKPIYQRAWSRAVERWRDGKML